MVHTLKQFESCAHQLPKYSLLNKLGLACWDVFHSFPFFRYIFTQQMSFSGDQEPKFSRQEIGIWGKKKLVVS